MLFRSFFIPFIFGRFICFCCHLLISSSRGIDHKSAQSYNQSFCNITVVSCLLLKEITESVAPIIEVSIQTNTVLFILCYNEEPCKFLFGFWVFCVYNFQTFFFDRYLWKYNWHNYGWDRMVMGVYWLFFTVLCMLYDSYPDGQRLSWGCSSVGKRWK